MERCEKGEWVCIWEGCGVWEWIKGVRRESGCVYEKECGVWEWKDCVRRESWWVYGKGVVCGWEGMGRERGVGSGRDGE